MAKTSQPYRIKLQVSGYDPPWCVVRIGRLQTRATVLTCAQPTPFARPALRYLQPRLLPEPMHALRVHRPAVLAQKRRDLPVTEARVPLSKLVDASHQHAVFLWLLALIALRRTRLLQHVAGPPLAYAQLPLDVAHGPAAARRARREI